MTSYLGYGESFFLVSERDHSLKYENSSNFALSRSWIRINFTYVRDISARNFYEALYFVRRLFSEIQAICKNLHIHAF